MSKKTKSQKKNKKPQKPELNEVAGLAADPALSKLLDEIVQPDNTVLRSLGWKHDEYRSLMRDDQVKAAFSQRLDALTSKETIILPGGDSAADKAAAEFMEQQLASIDWDAKCRKMAHAQMFGYSVAEILWSYDGSHIIIDDIKVRKFTRFRYDGSGRLRLLKQGAPKGEIMPERKFWVSTVEADNDDDPYGLGLAYYLYWPVYLKRNGWRFWAVALEKFGSPTVLGKYAPGTSEKDIASLLSVLAALHSQSAVTIPEGQSVQLLEAVRASGGDHEKFVAYLDAMIAKIILGQTSTTDSGSWRGTANVHKEVRDEIIKADCDLLCGGFNRGPALWLTEWNFSGANPPKVWRVLEDGEDLTARAKRDKIIYDMGFKPTTDYIKNTYGGDWSEVTSTTTNGSTANFAEDDPDAIDDAVEDALNEWEPMATKALDPVLKLVENAKSLEDIRNGLEELYPGMDIDELAENLHRLGTMTEIAARAGAELS